MMKRRFETLTFRSLTCSVCITLLNWPKQFDCVFLSQTKKVFDEVFAINHNQIHSYSKSSKFYSWTISSNPLISPNFLKVFLSSEDFLQLFGIIQRLGFNNRFGFLHKNQHENDTLTNESSKETKENEAVSDIYRCCLVSKLKPNRNIQFMVTFCG